MEKRTRITPEVITSLDDDEIFVFGSNLAGNHAGGAARTALKWGAIMGKGTGLQGKTYAIPTMFKTIEEIEPYVKTFIEYAKRHQEKQFLVTEIGCGIAEFIPEQIAPSFTSAFIEDIKNIRLPEKFWMIIIAAEGSDKD
jgi:hypothetical protein